VSGTSAGQASGFSLPIQIVEAGGISAWLVEDHSVPVVSIAWSWQGGASLDPPGQEGAAAMAGALLTEGAGPLLAARFADALRDEAISLGFSAGRDGFEGSFRALTEALPQALDLARLAMAEPRLDAEAVERVRARAVAGARRVLETPRGQAGRAFWREAFPDHPAGRPSSGTAESLAALPVEAMRAAIQRQLRRDGLLVTASGDITAGQLQALLPRLFAGLPAGEPPQAAALPGFRAFGQQLLPVVSPQSTVVFGQDGLDAADPDWEAAQVVLRILAGGGFTSRLMQAVREQRGLAYGIGGSLEVLFRHGIIIGSVATENARVAETLAVTRAEWARMAESGPTATELADAVAFLTGSLPLSFTDSRRIANVLLALRQNGRPVDWLEGRPARLQALTRVRLAAVAARLLRPQALAVVVAGQPVGL
jgi:zinc protease